MDVDCNGVGEDFALDKREVVDRSCVFAWRLVPEQGSVQERDGERESALVVVHNILADFHRVVHGLEGRGGEEVYFPGSGLGVVHLDRQTLVDLERVPEG